MPSAGNLPRGEPYAGVFAGANRWRPIDQVTVVATIEGMIAMAQIEPGTYLTVVECSEYMKCSEAWVRTLLGRGGLRGARRIGQRVWLIPEAAAREARDSLTTRSKGRRHLAKRPAAGRKKAAAAPVSPAKTRKKPRT